MVSDEGRSRTAGPDVRLTVFSRSMVAGPMVVSAMLRAVVRAIGLEEAGWKANEEEPRSDKQRERSAKSFIVEIILE